MLMQTRIQGHNLQGQRQRHGQGRDRELNLRGQGQWVGFQGQDQGMTCVAKTKILTSTAGIKMIGALMLYYVANESIE